MYIVMLGAPGTGKGTIGKILSKDLNLVHISTGDIFREQINKGDESYATGYHKGNVPKGL